MKTSLLVCLALFAFRAFAAADLTVVQTIQSSAGTNKVTLKIKGDKARIESTPESTMIVDGKSGDVVTLMPKEKAVLRIPGAQAKTIGGVLKGRLHGADSSFEVVPPKPTGRKEKIDGYDTEEYAAETPKYTATYWVATTYPDYGAILRQMKLLQSGALTAVRSAMPEYYDFPGLPVRTKIKMQGAPELTITLSSISQAPIPESEFTVPAGYSEVKLPGWLSGTPPPGIGRPEESSTPQQ